MVQWVVITTKMKGTNLSYYEVHVKIKCSNCVHRAQNFVEVSFPVQIKWLACKLPQDKNCNSL